MGHFSVNCKELKKESDDLKKQSELLKKQYLNFIKTQSDLDKTLQSVEMKKALSSIEEQLLERIEVYRVLAKSLHEISEAYKNSELRISQQVIEDKKIKKLSKGETSASNKQDEEFFVYLGLLMVALTKKPLNWVLIKELLWKIWATDTGNEIEEKVFSKYEDIISKYLAFEYNEEGDYYITDENYGIQRRGGFMDLFDYLAGPLGMELDTEVLTFTPEGSDKEYRLQFWKGSYGWDGAYGGEIGLYSRSAEEAETNPYTDDNPYKKLIHYDCVSGEDEIKTTQVIYSTEGDILFSNSTSDYAENGDHFWNLAIKTDPGYDADDLVIEEYITVEDEAMREAIIEACAESNNLYYNDKKSTNNVIVIQYGKFNNE